MIGEIKYRVKNILSAVQAIARQTMERERTEAHVTFEKRILALGRAQDLITRDAREAVDLKGVVASGQALFPQSQFRDAPAFAPGLRIAISSPAGNSRTGISVR